MDTKTAAGRSKSAVEPGSFGDAARLGEAFGANVALDGLLGELDERVTRRGRLGARGRRLGGGLVFVGCCADDVDGGDQVADAEGPFVGEDARTHAVGAEGAHEHGGLGDGVLGGVIAEVGRGVEHPVDVPAGNDLLERVVEPAAGGVVAAGGAGQQAVGEVGAADDGDALVEAAEGAAERLPEGVVALGREGGRGQRDEPGAGDPGLKVVEGDGAAPVEAGVEAVVPALDGDEGDAGSAGLLADEGDEVEVVLVLEADVGGVPAGHVAANGGGRQYADAAGGYGPVRAEEDDRVRAVCCQLLRDRIEGGDGPLCLQLAAATDLVHEHRRMGSDAGVDDSAHDRPSRDQWPADTGSRRW